MLRYKWGKKAQIGETITWFPATIIILMVVAIFVLLAFLISQTKTVSIGDVRTNVGKNSEQLAMKTTLAEKIMNNENKPNVDAILKKQNGG